MLFVGGGFLLAQAVRDAVEAGHAVDAVVCPPGDSAIPRLRLSGVAIIETADPNRAILDAGLGESDIVFSINNAVILSDAALSSGPRVFNIHSGLVQAYRGIAELCLFAAICRGERDYGVTLHRLLPGRKVDRGTVVAQDAFAIGDRSFAEVMTQALAACQAIFRTNLAALAAGSAPEREVAFVGTAFSYADLPRLIAEAPADRLARACDLGAYRHFLSKLAAAVDGRA